MSMTDIAAQSRVKKIEALKLTDVSGAVKTGTARLILECVTVQYGGVLILDSLSLEVCDYELAALTGPGGSGKTTVLNCIAGECGLANGRILLNGEVIAENHPKGRSKNIYKGDNANQYKKTVRLTPNQIAKRGVVRVKQDVGWNDRPTVFDVLFYAKINAAKRGMFGVPLQKVAVDADKMRRETADLLDVHNLSQWKDLNPAGLPYAVQRRLAIAEALATTPSLLLLDEPSAEMSPEDSLDLYEHIKRIKNSCKLAVLMIEPSWDLALKMSDRVFSLDRGRLIPRR